MRWNAANLLIMLLRAGIAAPQEAAASEGESASKAYPVREMLSAGVDAMRVEALKAQAGGVSMYLGEATRITDGCAPRQLGVAWTGCFQASVDMTLRKNKRDMQSGLQGLAQCVLQLLDSLEVGCQKLQALQALREQAARLSALASTGSLARLDAKHVKYEPLKSLTIADVDVHAELNELLFAWQMNKGPTRTGQALAKFLAEFASEPGSPEPVERTATEPGHHTKTTPQFWADALNRALENLGNKSQSVQAGSAQASCVSEGVIKEYCGNLDSAFGSMMQRTQAGLQSGLKMIARDTLSFMDAVEATCSGMEASHSGAKRLRTAASRLQVLAGARNLRSTARVDYEATKALKVGGVDVHKELNNLILSWRNNLPGPKFGAALALFFSDFDAAAEEDSVADQGSVDRQHPVRKFLRDAFLEAAAAADLVEKVDLRADCFPVEVTDVFVEQLNRAIDNMLEKRKGSVQMGLQGVADATEKILAGAPTHCTGSAGAKLVWLAAKKLHRAPPMKSLRVEGVPVHAELNGFVMAWKLRSQDEAGRPFGKLMQKLTTISGHDEL